jgi:hypothetical protein
VRISSANISGHHCKFAAALPQQKPNKAIDSAPALWIGPLLSAKSQIKQTHNPFPSFIAINSQLQEGLGPLRRNGTGT